MQNVKVKNMTSAHKRIGPLLVGKPVPNQFIITTPEGEYFQSYNSVIAFKPKCVLTQDPRDCIGKDCHGYTVLDKNYWDYSATTGKYRNQFLCEEKAETQKKINSGEYVLADLNA